MKFEKFWILPVVCSIIAMVFVSPGLAQVDYDKAYELYKAKKYSEAIPMLEEWCNKYPKDPRGGYTLAQSYVKTKQQKKAMERLNIVLGHHPDHAPSQFLAGVLKLKSSPAKAMPHFEAAVAAKPDNGNYQYYYGSALMASKRYNEAEAALKKAVKANPKNGKAQLDLRRVLMLNKKPADALAPLQVAAKGKIMRKIVPFIQVFIILILRIVTKSDLVALVNESQGYAQRVAGDKFFLFIGRGLEIVVTVFFGNGKGRNQLGEHLAKGRAARQC